MNSHFSTKRTLRLKRWTSLLLAVILVLTLCTTAYASTDEGGSASGSAAELTIGSATGMGGDTVQVTVSAGHTPTAIGSYGMRIDFDPTLLEVKSITGEAGTYFSSHFNNAAGWLKAAWSDSDGGDTPIAEGDKLFTVTVKIKGLAAGSAELKVVQQEDENNLTAATADGTKLAATVTPGMVTWDQRTPVWTDITGTEVLNHPYGIALDNGGSLYVTDNGNRLLKQSNGIWTDLTGDGNLKVPRGVAVDSSGTVYVADMYYSRIKQLSNGSWTDITGDGQFSLPNGIAVDKDGTLYVADMGNNQIKAGSAGSWTNLTGSELIYYPMGVAVDGSGNVYAAATNNNAIKVWTNGSWATLAGATFYRPGSVAVDGSGIVYVADTYNQKIKRLADGTWTDITGTESFNYPSGIAVDRDGNVYVADTNNSRIKKLIVNAPAPAILTQPADAAVNVGAASPSLSVTASTYDDGELSYQWYSTDKNSTDGGTPIAGATGSAYSAPTQVPGTVYYYVVVTNTDNSKMGAKHASVTSSAAKVTVTSAGYTGTPNTQGGSATDVVVLVNGSEEKIGRVAASTEGERTVTTVTVNQPLLDAKLDAAGEGAVVTIPVSAKSDIVIGELNGQMVKSLEDKQAVLVLQTNQGSYTIPARQLDIAALSGQLGSTAALQEIKVQIRIASPAAPMMKVAEAAAEQNAFMLLAPPVEFTVKAMYGSAAVEASKFNVYVERSIALPEGVNPQQITTGVVTEADGTVRHVPTKVTVVDGRYYAQIKSLTNSVYAVVWHPVEFKDVAGHWAKDAVNDMGSRLVVTGVGDGLFKPDEAVTRAEFAAILVRGLGLKEESGSSTFTDVAASAWYRDAVQTAYAHKLIDGFEDGAFRPNERITREQAMLIMAKAMGLTGLEAKLPAKDSSETLKLFADAAAASNWARDGIAASVRAGLITGKSAEELAPKAFITRAEVAAIVQRLLKQSDLI